MIGSCRKNLQSEVFGKILRDGKKSRTPNQYILQVRSEPSWRVPGTLYMIALSLEQSDGRTVVAKTWNLDDARVCRICNLFTKSCIEFDQFQCSNEQPNRPRKRPKLVKIRENRQKIPEHIRAKIREHHQENQEMIVFDTSCEVKNVVSHNKSRHFHATDKRNARPEALPLHPVVLKAHGFKIPSLKLKN